MGRARKKGADWFSHDVGMRNDIRIKAVRNKFGIRGYAIWNMFLEHLAGEDGNEFFMSNLNLNLLAGDFGCEPDELKGVIEYCLELELFQNDEGHVFSEELDSRLASMYAKRKTNKTTSDDQPRNKNGRFRKNKVRETDISGTETPQSKVKYSTVKNSIFYFKINEKVHNERISEYFKREHTDFLNTWNMQHKREDILPGVFESMDVELNTLNFNTDNHIVNTFKQHFKRAIDGTTKPTYQDRTKRTDSVEALSGISKSILTAKASQDGQGSNTKHHTSD